MTSLHFPILLLLLALLSRSIHAATSPYAYRTGKIVYYYSIPIPTGNYTIRNVATNQYLLFHPNKVTNTVVPAKGAQNNVSAATTWKFVQHGAKNYSIHHRSRNGSDKCVSTRYNGGKDDAAVMWGCRIDTAHPIYTRRSQRLERRLEPVFYTKQTWLFIPVKYMPNTYYIVSNAHLYNLVPACLYPKRTSRGTTALRDCMPGNGKRLYKNRLMHWELKLQS